MLFNRILDESSHKPKKIWVDKGSKFYDRSMKSWLQDNNREMYSAYNDGKFVVAERFVITLKIKFANIWIQYQKRCILIQYMI